MKIFIVIMIFYLGIAYNLRDEMSDEASATMLMVFLILGVILNFWKIDRESKY